MYRVLLVGAGRERERRIAVGGRGDWEGSEVVTLDNSPTLEADIHADLNVLPYDWAPDGSFDEVHAYEVLEHLGAQGDYKHFFGEFNEWYRILRPGGWFCATVPMWNTVWALGEPSHTRIINPGTLVFLDQEEYRLQCDQGHTMMSDFRHVYKGDFERSWIDTSEGQLRFALRRKP